MSRRRNPERGPDGGREGEEPSGGSLALDAELEAALRAAAEAVEAAESGGARAQAARPEEPGGHDQLPHEPFDAGAAESLVFRLREELAEKGDRLIRLQADFDNFRKRALKERQEAVQYGHLNLFKDLLSVVDNLERAIGHASESGSGDLESFLQGVELVRRELLGVFEKNHVTEIEAKGKPFDPALHEAMGQMATDAAPPGTVVEVLEKGFQLRDRLVRPARVMVAREPDAGAGDGGESAG